MKKDAEIMSKEAVKLFKERTGLNPLVKISEEFQVDKIGEKQLKALIAERKNKDSKK